MSHNAPRPMTERETVHEYLTVRQVQVRSDLERILPVGEIDLVTAPALRDVLADTESRAVPNVVVDLSRVRFLALVGARVLHTAAERTAGTDRRVALAAPTSFVQRVLRLTDVDGVAPTFPSVESAISALAPVS